MSDFAPALTRVEKQLDADREFAQQIGNSDLRHQVLEQSWYAFVGSSKQGIYHNNELLFGTRVSPYAPLDSPLSDRQRSALGLFSNPLLERDIIVHLLSQRKRMFREKMPTLELIEWGAERGASLEEMLAGIVNLQTFEIVSQEITNGKASIAIKEEMAVLSLVHPWNELIAAG